MVYIHLGTLCPHLVHQVIENPDGMLVGNAFYHISHNGNFAAMQVTVQQPAVIRYRAVRTCHITLIPACQNLQGNAGILDGSCKVADMIKRACIWNDAIAADAAIGRLDTHDAIVGSWFADRVAGI